VHTPLDNRGCAPIHVPIAAQLGPLELIRKGKLPVGGSWFGRK